MFDPIQPLNFRRECEEFFGRHLYRLLEEDLDFVFASAKRLALAADNQLYVLVPMHAREQGLRAYLNRLLPQARSTGSVLIILFNAYSEQMKLSEFSGLLSGANAEVNAAKDRLAYSQIFLFDKFFNERPTMGRIRGLMTDTALLNAYRSGSSRPLLLCNDVDTVSFSSSYLSSYAEIFDHNPFVKMACGAVNYGYLGTDAIGLPSGLAVPELFIFNELNKAINRCARLGLINFERRLWMEGSNMAFSGAAYCACGGFDLAKASGEDDDLSRALHRYNPNAYQAGVLEPHTIYEPDPAQCGVFNESGWIVTNARRILLAISEGLPGIEAWADLPFIETVGASFDVKHLAEKCDALDGAITTQMIRAARTNDSLDIRETILHRLKYIVFRSIAYDRKAQTAIQQEAVLAHLGVNYSDQGGSFLWSSPIMSELLTFGEG